MTLEQLAEHIDRLEVAIHALPFGDARDRVEAEHEELLDEYDRRAIAALQRGVPPAD